MKILIVEDLGQGNTGHYITRFHLSDGSIYDSESPLTPYPVIRVMNDYSNLLYIGISDEELKKWGFDYYKLVIV